MTRTLRRDPRTDRCACTDCGAWAKGSVWPIKHVGKPLPPPFRACEHHLAIAELAGATVQYDRTPA